MEVTEDFLRRYQKAMMAKGTSVNTVAIYLRNLRKIFNDAIAAKIISADYYPFGRRAFQIQTMRKHKQALSVEQKNKVLERLGEEAVDFWAFSYFCNGMNITDICHLRRGDIQDGFIVFRRAKTKRTSKELNDIYVPVRPEVEAIIARRGNKSLDPSAYLFPVLHEGLTPQQAKNRVLDFTDKVNKGLKEIAKDLKFTFKFTTYTARHTFATISINSGASLEFVQEALGHSDLKTTRAYFAGFDKETKRQASERL